MMMKIVFFIIGFTLTLNAQDINLDKLSKEAVNKHVLVFFHMTHCPYCEKMLEKPFNDPELKKVLNRNFIIADININTGGKIKYKDFEGSKYNFSEAQNIHFYPTVLFINDENKIVYSVKGYRNKEKFSTILNYIKSNSYVEMSYDGYLDDLEFNKE